MSHAFLALSCIALLGVIAAQDWLYIPLRNETISAGLTGPYHWWLDASYVPLSIAVATHYHGLPGALGFIQGALGIVAALSLILVAATNTGYRWFDKKNFGGVNHSVWHSRFTLAVFTSVLALEIAGDIRTHSLGWLTGLNVIIPAIAYAYFHFRPTTIKGVTIAASPAAEKLYTLGLCVWMIV